MNYPKPSLLGNRKWRHLRNQTAGSLIKTLNHKIEKFERRANRVANSRNKLEKRKRKLSELISTYQKYEREVNQHQNILQNRLYELDAVIEENKGAEGLSQEEICIIIQARMTFNFCQGSIRESEHASRTWNRIVPSRRAENFDEHSRFLVPVLRIPNVNPNGTLAHENLLKFNSFKTCVICWKKDIDSMIYTCGHQCCCFECGNKVLYGNKKCPICHRSARKVIKIYFSGNSR